MTAKEWIEIPLTQGRSMLVDLEDASKLFGYAWSYDHGYGARKYRVPGGQRKVYAHRLLIDASARDVVDHINGNTLDNRKSNLRRGSQHANSQNRHKRVNKFGFVGVSRGVRGRYRATMRVEGQTHNLGGYDSAEEAHKNYLLACALAQRGFSGLTAVAENGKSVS